MRGAASCSTCRPRPSSTPQGKTRARPCATEERATLAAVIRARAIEPPRAERDRIESEWNLPACDVFRKNAEPLVETVLEMLKD